MEIIESFTESKRGIEELNEDGFFISDDYVAVIDGVTSKSKEKIWSPSPGAYAKNVAIQALKDADSALDSIAFYHFLNERLKAEYKDIEYFANHSVDRLQINLVVYSRFQNEVWLFGDCQCLVDGKHITNSKKIDKLLSEVRSFVYQCGQAVCKPDLEEKKDPGREAILPFLEMQSNLANSSLEYGYIVMDGIGNCPEKIKVVKLENTNELVLASDGYPYLFSNT